MRAVFLDVDGVLNCQSTKEHIPGTKIRGIDFQKVQILKRITELYPDTVIILISTWKDTWQPGGGQYADARYLEDTLKKAGLRIEAKTQDDWIDRGAGIRRYLEAHPEIESFVILDDEVFDYEEQGLMPHVIRTSWQYIGGLREKHVKQAEEILKREARQRSEEMVEQEAWKGPEEILKRDARNRPAEGGTGAGTGTGTGILYGVGVGPGDPELLTLKAVSVLKRAEVIAAPGEKPTETAAYRIAVQAVPEIGERELLAVPMPMVTDPAILEAAHRKGAELLEAKLKTGRSVAFLTLGDPTVYSTFSYLEARVRADGYPTKYISGITSFCAAAAALQTPLAEGREALHIYPAAPGTGNTTGVSGPGNAVDADGTEVFMKSGRAFGKVKKALEESGRRAVMAENVGMPGERLYRSLQEMPEQAGYFTLLIAKPPEEKRY